MLSDEVGQNRACCTAVDPEKETNEHVQRSTEFTSQKCFVLATHYNETMYLLNSSKIDTLNSPSELLWK